VFFIIFLRMLFFLKCSNHSNSTEILHNIKKDPTRRISDRIIRVNWWKSIGWRSWCLQRVHWELSMALKLQLSGLSSQTLHPKQLNYIPLHIEPQRQHYPQRRSKWWHTSLKTPVVPLNPSSVVARCAGSSDVVIPLTSFYSLILHLNLQRWSFVCWITSDSIWKLLRVGVQHHQMNDRLNTLFSIFGCYSSSNFIKELPVKRRR